MEEEKKPEHITIREPALTILEAELSASPPERVAQWLEIRASAQKESTREHDEQLESALLDRGDPLINLALARYAIRESTLQRLFQSATSAQTRAVRIAVLSNGALLPHNNMMGGLIEALIGFQADIGRWLTSLSHSELGALLQNGSVGSDFLSDFLSGKKGWLLLDESEKLFALRMIARNPLVSAEYESIELDGYEEYKHSAVHDAVWCLASTAPRTLQWCLALSALFAKTLPEAFSIKDPLHLAKRWVSDAQERIEYGYMGHFGEVRLQIARLALRSHGSGAEKLLKHDDPAIRASAYAYGDLTEAGIKAAAERDPSFAFEKLVRNEQLWRRALTRDIVRKLAWEQADPHSRMDGPNIYLHIEAQMKIKHPAWFEEQAQFDDEELPATRREINEISTELFSRLDTAVSCLAKVQADTGVTRVRAGWLWWGIAAVIAILVYRFF